MMDKAKRRRTIGEYH